MGFLDNLRNGLENIEKSNEHKIRQAVRKLPDEGVLHNITHASKAITREICRDEAKIRGLI